MPRNSRNKWRTVNRCMVCGERLQFIKSLREGAQEPEGWMRCENKHPAFGVRGWYDDKGTWHLDVVLPRKVA